ncbi:hypothetical protein MCELHM10_00990 [Paracoccaceae bacterium]
MAKRKQKIFLTFRNLLSALPVARNGQSGKVLLCPQQAYPAATVADFCTAILTRQNSGRVDGLVA